MVPRDHDIYASPLSLLGNKEREEERDGKKERAYKAGEGEGRVEGVRGREVGDLTRAEKTFFLNKHLPEKPPSSKIPTLIENYFLLKNVFFENNLNICIEVQMEFFFSLMNNV